MSPLQVLLALLAAVSLVIAGSGDETLKRICANGKFKVVSVAQMMEVIVGLGQNEARCPDRFRASFRELEGILKLAREQLCSEHAFDLIRHYHFRFISPLRQLNRKPTQYGPYPREVVRAQLHPEPRSYQIQLDEYDQATMAPLAVRHFFLKFVLQVSGQCKRQLLANLAEAQREHLSQDDLEILDVLNEKSPIGSIMREGLAELDFDNVLYLPELEGKIRNLEGEVNKKVLVTMRVAQNSALYNLIGACQNRFKPIYDRLLMPVIHLSKLGYNYLGDRLSEEERRQLAGPEVKNWLAMVHVCEMFNKVIAIKGQWDEEGDANPLEEEEDDSEFDEIFDAPDEEEEEAAAAEAAEEEPLKLLGDGQLRVRELRAGDDSGSDEDLEAKEELADKLERQVQARRQLGWLGLGEANPIDYQPKRPGESCFAGPDGQLWVQGTSQLDLELSRKSGNVNPFGLRGFFRRAKRHIKRQFAKLDFKKFAHYRRHSAFYAGLLNFISALSNVASITTTLYFAFIMV